MKKPDKNYNRLGFYFFLVTTIFSSLWVMYFTFFNNSIDLGEITSSQIPKQTIKSEAPKQKKLNTKQVWISTDAFIARGSQIYKAQCALCHGPKGLGDGMPTLIPPPKNLVKGEWKQGGSSKNLFTTLTKGVPGTSMVSFKHLPKADRWALVHYIRSITRNKVTDNMKELEEFAQQAP